jgi:hypothetical protein
MHVSLLASAVARCAAITEEKWRRKCRKQIVCCTFTKPNQWPQVRESFGWTHLPDRQFMLRASSLHKVIVSAKAGVQQARLFLKRLWTECDRRSCGDRESWKDLSAEEITIPQPTAWKTVRERLKLKCYKFQILQQLHPDDNAKRATFCAKMMENISVEDDRCFQRWSQVPFIRNCQSSQCSGYWAWKPLMKRVSTPGTVQRWICSMPYPRTRCRPMGPSFSRKRPLQALHILTLWKCGWCHCLKTTVVKHCSFRNMVYRPIFITMWHNFWTAVCQGDELAEADQQWPPRSPEPR